jgi:hypothetical protein
MTQFKPGESGNPNGRPRGARNKTTLAVEALLDGEADAITRKAIELAKAGDGAALRMCMDRIAPARKDNPVQFDLPKMEKAADAVTAAGAIAAAVAAGDITPQEAGEFSKLVDSFTRAITTTEVAERLTAIERQLEQQGKTR